MIGIREVFCSKFQAMSKGSRDEFNRVSLSDRMRDFYFCLSIFNLHYYNITRKNKSNSIGHHYR